MKDHEKRELINKLRDIAVQFAHTQQLRQRIAEVVLDALAEHEKEQEPVAWRTWWPKMGGGYAWAYGNAPALEDNLKNEPFYTAPPQREWQGLTDEEINTIAATPAAIPGSYVHSFARAIEAKLKEKNS